MSMSIALAPSNRRSMCSCGQQLAQTCSQHPRQTRKLLVVTSKHTLGGPAAC